MQRRRILATAAGAAFGALMAPGGPVFAQSPPVPVAADEFRVTLLGTGSPAPVMRRFGPGVLVQAGLRLGQVDALFLTHLHSDHIVGIPDLWLTGWLEAAYAQRKGPFVVHGPAGTQALMAFRLDRDAVTPLPVKAP
jgi:ribonuclease Z